MNWTTNLEKAAILLLSVITCASPQAQTVDLANGVSGSIGGVLFEWTGTQPTGTGFIDSFVRIQGKGIEQGYNTSGRPFAFDEKEPLNFTHDVQIRDLGAGIDIGGVVYYQFLLDVNEPGNSKAFLSLDEIRLYTSPTGNKTTENLDELGTLIFDLKASGENWILLDASRNHGSGSGDMFMYVPKSFFANGGPDDYFYLYSKFGGFFEPQSGAAQAGFEEWAIVFHEPAPDCPVATATGGTLTCDSDTIQLQATSSLPGSSFRWTGPNGFTSTEQNPAVRLPGTYQVTVTAGNCEDTAMAQVEDGTLEFSISATGGELTCDRQTVQLTASSAQSGLRYSWTGPGVVSGGNTATPTVNRPGTYKVVATDQASGCTAQATAVVTQIATQFTVTVQGGVLDCDHLTVQLSASASIPGATFSWEGPGIISGAETATPTVSKPGIYTVTATVADCSSTTTASVSSQLAGDTFIPNLPTETIHFKAHVGSDAAFEVELQDVPPGFTVSNGKFKGWCLEEEDALPTGYVWPGKLLNPYGGTIPDSLRNQAWNHVNYILNHKGTATSDDVQKAIWHFVGGSTTTPVPLTAAAQALVIQAEENADCFTPRPGHVTGEILEPSDDGQQRLMIEIPVQGTSDTLLMASETISSAGQMSVSFSGPANRDVIVETSTNLRDWQFFKSLANPTGQAETILPVSATTRLRFYRARAE